MTTPQLPPTTGAALRCDVRRFPLITFTQIGTLGLPDVHYNIACLQAILQTNVPFVSVYDARAAGRHDPASNKTFNEHFKQLNAEMGRLCLGTAYVVDSVLLRMALRGFMLVMRPPFPYDVFSSITDAESWCQARLSAASAR